MRFEFEAVCFGEPRGSLPKIAEPKVMAGLTDRELLNQNIAALRQTIHDRWLDLRGKNLSPDERRSLRRVIVHCIADLGSVLVQLDQVADVSYGQRELRPRD